MFGLSRMQLFAVTMTLCASACVQGSIVSNLTPVGDAFVSSANPSGNYGGGGSLAISAAGLANGEFSSVLRFDTLAAKTSFDTAYGPGNWNIQSVSLRLTAASPNNPIFNSNAAGQFSVRWMQNDSWTEGTGSPSSPGASGITYNSLPSFLGPADAPLGTFSYSGASSGSATYPLGLAASLQNDVLSGGLLSMHLFAADNSLSYLFNSRSFTVSANRPQLSITAIPEPAGISMLMPVLAVMLGARLRRMSIICR